MPCYLDHNGALVSVNGVAMLPHRDQLHVCTQEPRVAWLHGCMATQLHGRMALPLHTRKGVFEDLPEAFGGTVVGECHCVNFVGWILDQRCIVLGHAVHGAGARGTARHTP